MTDDYPPAFLATLRDLFGDVDKAKAEHVRRLYRIWTTAQDDERRAAFRFVRGQIERSKDKEMLVLLSWMLGNGSYRETPDLGRRPWLVDARDWKAYVADRLEVHRAETNRWKVRLRETDEFVALITKDDETGNYEVWHNPEDPAEMAQVRWHQTWTEAAQDVVATQLMREFPAHPAHPDVEKV